MTFTVDPDATPFADLMALVELANPYAGLPLRSETPPGEVGVRLLWPPAEVDGSPDPFVEAIRQMEAHEWKQAKFILDCIAKALGHVILVSDALPKRAVFPETLSHVAPSRLRYGVFDAIHYRLETLRAYQGASIFVPDVFARKVLQAIPCAPNVSGRPEHPGKAWYAKRSFDRQGLSLNALQRAMQGDGLDQPPSVSTIRAWEREYKKRQKPLVETPK